MPPRTTADSLPLKKPLRWFALLLFTLVPALASAQQQGLEIDIIGGNASALPITVVPMPYQGRAAAPPTDVSAVVRADLERSGAFRALPEEDKRDLDANKAIALMLAQPSMIKRPMLDRDGALTAGFKPDIYETLF